MKGGNVDWIDPIFGARLAGQLGEKWTLRGRTDIGGFGIGSKLTWQLAPYIDFRASNLIAKVLLPKVAARYLQLDNRINLLHDLQLASRVPLVK